jgi:hypothetical protein
MQKWEYLYVRIGNGSSQGQFLVQTSHDQAARTEEQTTPGEIVSELGDDGWEMVGWHTWALSDHPNLTQRDYIFKRPKE